MPEFDPPLKSLLKILNFAFISFLLFSKIISILSKKFHIFELNFLLDDAHGLEEDAHALRGANETRQLGLDSVKTRSKLDSCELDSKC